MSHLAAGMFLEMFLDDGDSYPRLAGTRGRTHDAVRPVHTRVRQFRLIGPQFQRLIWL